MLMGLSDPLGEQLLLPPTCEGLSVAYPSTMISLDYTSDDLAKASSSQLFLEAQN